MKELTMFMQKTCPHCLLARKLIAQLCEEDARYAALPIHMVDERAESELANSYDYWYVPCFYLDKKKLHEGHAEYADVKMVLDEALQAE